MKMSSDFRHTGKRNNGEETRSVNSRFAVCGSEGELVARCFSHLKIKSACADKAGFMRMSRIARGTKRPGCDKSNDDISFAEGGGGEISMKGRRWHEIARIKNNSCIREIWKYVNSWVY